MKKSPLPSLLAAIALFSSLGPLAVQAATSAATNRPADASITVLSPFEVSAPQGYIMGNALSATGIGSEIRDIPINITVLTDQFILDRNYTFLTEALNFVSGVTSQGRDLGRINIRGFDALTQRDSMPAFNFIPTDGIQQIEILKGPSAVFHGRVRPGGIINQLSYSPSFTRETVLQMEAGTDGYYKGMIRTTGPLIDDKLAYLFIASRFQEDSTIMDYKDRGSKYHTGKLTFKASPALSFTFSYEDVFSRNRPGQEIIVSHPAFVAAAQRGAVTAGTTSPGWVAANIGPAEPPGAAIVTDLVFPSRYFNPRGPDNETTQEGRIVRGQMHWHINPWLSLRVSGQDLLSHYRELWVNLFRWEAGGTWLNNQAIDNQIRTERRDYEAELSLRTKVAGTSHKLLGGFERNDVEGRNITQRGVRVNYNPFRDGVRRITSEMNQANPNGFNGLFDNRALWSLSKVDSLYLTDQIQLWEDRVGLVLGSRYTKETSGRATKVSVSESTSQFGGYFRPAKSITLFANYSDTFEPNFTIDALTGKTAPTSVGDGYEFGAKLELLQNRLFATASIFNATFLRAAIDNRKQIELNLFPIFLPGGEAQKSEGLDLDLTYAPSKALTVLFSYSNIWTSKTTRSESQPRQVGRRLDNTPEHKAGYWTKYTFGSGALKGAFLGGGLRYRGRIFLHPSWEQSVTDRGRLFVDLLAGYKRNNYSVTLNVQNATNVSDYIDGQISWGEGVRGILSFRVNL